MAHRKTGLYAVVRNSTLGGRPIIEGVAQVVRALGEDRYSVRFADGMYERFVAQEDLHGNMATAMRHAKEARRDLAKA